MKLAHPALLRPLASKHRSHIVELSHRLALVHLRLDVSAHNPRRSFGPERKAGWFRALGASTIAVVESVHFLLDNIGGLADRAAEKLGLFYYRNANLRKIVGAEDLARFGFTRLPHLHLPWQDIGEASDGRNSHFL